MSHYRYYKKRVINNMRRILTLEGITGTQSKEIYKLAPRIFLNLVNWIFCLAKQQPLPAEISISEGLNQVQHLDPIANMRPAFHLWVRKLELKAPFSTREIFKFKTFLLEVLEAMNALPSYLQLFSVRNLQWKGLAEEVTKIIEESFQNKIISKAIGENERQPFLKAEAPVLKNTVQPQSTPSMGKGHGQMPQEQALVCTDVSNERKMLEPFNSAPTARHPNSHKKKRGRPQKVSDEVILRLAHKFGQISQPEVRELTGMKQNTLSSRVRTLESNGLIKTYKIREGKSNFSFLTLTAKGIQNVENHNQELIGLSLDHRIEAEEEYGGF